MNDTRSSENVVEEATRAWRESLGCPVAHGLAPLRNKLSDGHARVHKPAPHHARLVVNAAKTVTAFRVDSYGYQTENGLHGTPAQRAAKERR
ncbi:MAG: abortive infection family protein [Deltaproteobacteria bacterium]|nr:abortive infection family protein [Deltaproteobacteria bacterium]